MAITINWGTKVISIPQSFLLPGSGPDSFLLDTNAFRIALKDLEDSEEGMAFPPTHNHNTAVNLGGITYARIIEIINGYTITFEETGTPYKVSLIGSNNNILDATNLGTVSVAPNNSAGLIESKEIQQGAFNNQVTINTTTGTAGTLYPIGTGTKPAISIADAKTIAVARGLDTFFIQSNYTVPSATDPDPTLAASGNIAGYHIRGKGATLNVSTTDHTRITLTNGCITTNAHYHNCIVSGYQGGESLYTDCVIDGLDNAHCIYTRCGLIDGSVLGYTIRQANFTTSTHASYFKECFSDEGTAIFDRAGTGLNVTFDGFMGRLKFINQNGTITKSITSASWSSGVATYLSAAHGALVGNRVTISGITPSGYNGTYVITTVSTNSFTVAMTSDPGAYVSGGSSGMLYGKNSNVWIHLNGGTVTIDSSCTTGKITVSGSGVLVNQAAGTEVDASGFIPEGFEQTKLNIESLRQTHQGFGARWFVDPVAGNDLSPGNSSASPLRTVAAAISKAVSGRGDVIFLLAPAAGVATINERVVIDKEDLHIRGPGRGVQFQPDTANLGPVISIAANNCSMAGFIVRSPVGSTTDDCITVTGKFSRMEKLYIVGSGQGIGTASGIVYTHGDYHELIDCESEKNGRSGILIKDMSGGVGNGSPREISIKGGNYYLNGKDGIEFEGSGVVGSSCRLNRILGANIHDNLGYGVRVDALTSGTLISGDTVMHNNTTGNVLDLGLNTHWDTEQDYQNIASTVWGADAASNNTVGTMGAKLNSASAGGVDYGALAGAVWDATAADYNDAGTMGEKVNTPSAIVDNDAIATAVWAKPIEATFTAEQILRIAAAVLNGKVSGAGTGTETFTGIDGTTIRVVSNIDVNGNRTNVANNGA